MQLTVCCETLFTERPLAERFAAVRALGVDAVELWGLPPENAATVEAGLQSAGCRLHLFCGNRQQSLIDPDERGGFLAELRRSAALARRLGCRHLTILSDKVDANGIPIPPERPSTNDQKFASLATGLEQAVQIAEAENLTLLLEPLNTRIDHPGYTLAHSSQAFEIVRGIGSDRLKVLYDVYHMQIMEGNLIPTLEANLDAIGHLHVADVPGRHEPGTGEINYSRIADVLRANGYDRSIGLECFPKADSAAAIDSFCQVFR
jgi:hydroxypyruvate isomerase